MNLFLKHLFISQLHYPKFLTACLLLLVSLGISAQAREVRLQLTGAPQFQFAGYYVALEKGFYGDIGLDVKILFDDLTQTELIEKVVNREVEFAVGNSSLALAALQGKPIVVLANLFQRSSYVIIAKPDYGNQLFNISNKKTGLPTPTEAPEIYAFLTSQGILFSDVVPSNSKKNTLSDFIANKTPIYFGHLFNEPLRLQSQNIAYKVFDPVAYGIHFYGDTIFSNRVWVDQNYDVAKRFIAATMKGWEYALANQAEAAQILKTQVNASQSISELVTQAQIIKDLTIYESIELGHVDPDRWHLIADFFRRNNFVEQDSKLPKSFLLANWQPKGGQHYQLILEVLVAFLGVIVVIAMYWFYPKFIRLQKSVYEKELLVQEAQSKANEDPLTGLPNRRLLIEKLRYAADLFEQNQIPFALCFMDIDNFKIINDQYGHSVGDEILIQLAQRMQIYLTDSEMLARQGGDEFVLLLNGVSSAEIVMQKLTQLRAIIEAPLMVQEKTFTISVSFGYAIYQTDSYSIEDLLKVADRRMYREKFKNLNIPKSG